MDWVVLFWMRGVGVEWRLLESGFAGLWEIFRIETMRCIVFTLTFDSSPIKGEGIPPHRRPVDSRLRGNDGPGCWLVWLVSPSLPCQALGQALVLSRQGRRGILSVVLDLFTRVTPHPVDTALKPV